MDDEATIPLPASFLSSTQSFTFFFCGNLWLVRWVNAISLVSRAIFAGHVPQHSFSIPGMFLKSVSDSRLKNQPDNLGSGQVRVRTYWIPRCMVKWWDRKGALHLIIMQKQKQKIAWKKLISIYNGCQLTQ